MGRAKTGAVIVIEQKFVLNEYITTGILLDAIVKCTASGADLYTTFRFMMELL